MADYNIYIHAVGTGSGTSYNPTMPWSQRQNAQSQTESQGGSNVGGAGFNAAAMVTRAATIAQNPDAMVGSAFSNAMKAIPWVAAAFAVVKLTESVIDTAIEFGEIESGDYRGGNQWRDVKQMIKTMLHPVSTFVSHFKLEAEIKRDTQRAKLQQDLLGGSQVNSYTRRGV